MSHDANSSNVDRGSGSGGSNNGPDGSLVASAILLGVAFLYWYLLVFGAAADAAGLPVPAWLPLSPGWPPSDADLAPALEDSAHFFYLADLIEHVSGPGGSGNINPAAEAAAAQSQQPPVVRLAVFNVAESWVFAFLPALLADRRRLPAPVVLGTWFGALGLTNAFLAPYLALRELLASGSSLDDAPGDVEDDGADAASVTKMAAGGRNAVLSVMVGATASAVAANAVASSAGSSPEEWTDFARLAVEDRTYLAFCVDLVLFSVFQPFILRRVCEQRQSMTSDDSLSSSFKAIYNVPFVGLMAWLFGI